MEIPFTASETTELQAFLVEFNQIGETRTTVELYLADLIRHNTLNPWRERVKQKAAERRKDIIVSLPPEADAELKALAEKYAVKLTTRTR